MSAEEVACGQPGCCAKTEAPSASIGEVIAARLREKAAASYVDVVDESGGCGANLHITVVSTQFEKKSLLQQHRLVLSYVQDQLGGVHAYSFKLYTPEKWAARGNG